MALGQVAVVEITATPQGASGPFVTLLEAPDRGRIDRADVEDRVRRFLTFALSIGTRSGTPAPVADEWPGDLHGDVEVHLSVPVYTDGTCSLRTQVVGPTVDQARMDRLARVAMRQLLTALESA